MTASRRDTDRGSLLQSTMGSPQHRYPLRHERKGADAGADDGKRTDDAATRSENTAAGCLHVCVSPLPDAKGKRKISFATVSKRVFGNNPRKDRAPDGAPDSPKTVSSKKHKRRRRDSALPGAPHVGALGVLPPEMLEEVLFRCGTRELGVIQCVSKLFRESGIVERVAKRRVDAHPRADGVVSRASLGEKTNSAKILHFATSADVALRTAAGLDLGAFHTAVLGVSAETTFAVDTDGGDGPSRAMEEDTRDHQGSQVKKRTDARDFAERRGVGDEDFLDADLAGVPGGSYAGSYAWGPLPRDAAHVPSAAAAASRARLVASQPRGRALYTFGRGFHGQLGQGGYDDAARPHAVSLAGVAGIADPSALETVRCGASHCAALTPDGTLLTWGLASSGELGHGGWTPIEVDVPRAVASMASTRVAQVAAGANHTVAVSETGGLWTCGRGRHGQLGHGHFHDAGPLRRLDALRGMRVTHAVAGGAHSLCLTECGSVWSWGACRHGQLGLGDVAFATAAGWETGVPWPCLVESLQDLDEPVVTLAAGGHHTLFVTAGGQLWGCGRGEHGALGVGVRGGHADYYYYEEDQRGAVRGPRDHLVPRLVPVHHKPAPAKSGGAARVAALGFSQDHRSWWMAEAAVSAAPSAFDASALEASSASPREGALPLLFAAATLTATARKKRRNRRSMRASCGGPAARAATHPPPPASLRERESSEAPAPPFPGRGGWVKAPCSCGATCRVVLAAAGGSHSAVLTACGAVMTTGSNAYGQLGLGDARRRYAFERVESLRGARLATVAVGEDHSAAVAEDGRLFLWGRGDWGQLGTGDARSHFAPRLVAGVSVAPPVAPEKFLGFRGGASGAEESDDEEDPLREMGGANQHDVADPRAATAYA